MLLEPLNILILDDEEGMCKLLKNILLDENYHIEVTTSALDALNKIKNTKFSIAIVDIKMPDMNGIDFIKKATELDNTIQFIMITAYGSIENAVEAVKMGAFDYITKPFQADEIQLSVKKAIEHISLIEENRQLKRKLDILESKGTPTTVNSKMIDIINLAKKIASSNLSVLITGESGTGKEIMARYIHNISNRKENPFIPVQCSLLPASLLESELFGFKKGSFTGATENRAGLFEQANNGTIFLDEIGDISLDVQGKLLRFLQDKEVRRIGESKSIYLNVRLISATNKNLEHMIESKEFREDLYFRLKVINIQMPPLRDRKEDIPLLVNSFLKEINERLTQPITIQPECIDMLMEYNWPGNIRELKNCIESASALCDNNTITIKDIKSITQHIDCIDPLDREADSKYKQSLYEKGTVVSYREAKNKAIEEFETTYIKSVLAKNNGNISAASRDAGIDRKNFWQLLKKYNIDPDNYK